MKKITDSALKSWKTTTLGVISFGAGIYLFLKGHAWTEVAGAVTVGVGLILSKDGDQTHSDTPNEG